MTSGPQISAIARSGVEIGAWHHLRDDADVSAPARGRTVHGDFDLDVEAAAPVLQLPWVQELSRGASAVENDDVAVALAVGEQVVDHRAKRGEPDAAGHDDDVCALRLCQRPGATERAAHPHILAWSACAEGRGHGSYRSDRVHE